MPVTTSMPSRRAAVRASEIPAIVSWSVTAIVFRPASAARATSAAGPSSPSEAVVCRCRSITRSKGECGVSSRRLLAPRLALRRRRLALALEQGTIFANQELQVLALLRGELEEDLLALRVLEAIAVS